MTAFESLKPLPIPPRNVDRRVRGREGSPRRVGLLACAAALAVALAAGSAQAAATIVTALSGLTTTDGRALSSNELLADGVQLETDESGGCSLLHGAQLLVEMGPDTQLRIGEGSGGGTLVELQGGQARITTVRKRSDPRVEIRTPSALVRPMTSTIHIEVNATTGHTFVTSLDNRALVVSADPARKRSALLNSNQWVSVPLGSAPGAIKQVDPGSAAKIANVAIASSLRSAALDATALAEGRKMLDQIAAADVPDSAPAAISTPFDVPEGFVFGLEPLPRDIVCDPTSIGCGVTSLNFRDTRPGGPPICIGLPGEQCQR